MGSDSTLARGPVTLFKESNCSPVRMVWEAVTGFRVTFRSKSVNCTPGSLTITWFAILAGYSGLEPVLWLSKEPEFFADHGSC